MKKKFLVGLLSVAAVGLLAACGSSANSTKTSSSADSKDVTVRVALEADTQPLSYTDESGKLVGYEVDVINAINEVIEGYHIDVETVSAEAAETGLEAGTYDLIGGGLFKTEAREKAYLFPDENTGVSTVEIYKRTNEKNIQTLADLVGIKLHPVTANGGIYNLLTQYNKEHPNAQITINKGESGDIAQRFQAVNDGTYDAVVMSSNFNAENIIKQLNLNVEKADQPVRVNATYFVLSKKQEAFKKAFDKAVKTLKENGTLADLSKKWFNQNMFEYKITQ
ncbi:transporter substrate-binding domain-containing protein [Streptococcus sp. DD13]|uniref:transporter substrate-binding domain-containing protein n=1 Tax=Streptococcus sp. DD13 TaxID=1777881 RepID=UPI00079A8F61|nr:transporter substrate-binding domain-containing protein [Streptococcus sp. DD13]KXT77752.1 putative amino-acid ABC transporter extracellular-binding protein yckK precursor [Streptococcus sp. DD13]